MFTAWWSYIHRQPCVCWWVIMWYSIPSHNTPHIMLYRKVNHTKPYHTMQGNTTPYTMVYRDEDHTPTQTDCLCNKQPFSRSTASASSSSSSLTLSSSWLSLEVSDQWSSQQPLTRNPIKLIKAAPPAMQYVWSCFYISYTCLVSNNLLLVTNKHIKTVVVEYYSISGRAFFIFPLNG